MTTEFGLLFDDPTAAFHNHNPQSTAAFQEEIVPVLGPLLAQVLGQAAKYATRGIWVKQIIRDCGLSHQTASARMTDLFNAGLIRNTNMRIERCGVRVITELGQRALKKWQANQ